MKRKDWSHWDDYVFMFDDAEDNCDRVIASKKD